MGQQNINVLSNLPTLPKLVIYFLPAGGATAPSNLGVEGELALELGSAGVLG